MKEYVKTKSEGHFYIGGDVDENGIIKILNYFENIDFVNLQESLLNVVDSVNRIHLSKFW